MIDAASLSEDELDLIAETFDSVQVCDQTCLDVFIHNKWALHKTVEWAKLEAVYMKRAAFMIMTGLAKSDKETENFVFRVFLPVLMREKKDTRAEIQEAITMAFEAISSRNASLKKSVQKALETLP